jgi:hypothetical protein
MKKIFLLIPALVLALIANASKPTIIIDGDKSDWAEVPMLSEPGTWPMLKVLPAADAELGTNALVYMMENTADFDNTWAKYPTEFIDKDFDKATNLIDEYWMYPAMGIEYKATTGVNAGGWISFPKGISSDNKVIEIGMPSTYVTELGSKFSFGMYYGNGDWFLPDNNTSNHPEVSTKNGLLYKTRSFQTLPCTVVASNAYTHQSIGDCNTEIDFGIRNGGPWGGDTALWAAFPIELTQPALYDVTTNVISTNGWKFEFWVVNVETNAIVAHIDAPESDRSLSETSYKFGTLDLTNVPAGKYMLKVKNRTRYSTVKLQSVELSYAGGYVKDVPSTLNITDAIHNGKIKDGVIKFENATTGWAKWNISVATGTYFDVALSIKNQWGHNLTVTVYKEDGITLAGQVTEGSNQYSANEEGQTLNLGGLYLNAGKYVVKVTNATDGSDAKIMNLAFTYAGGAVQNMPGTTNIADAWFSANGTRADGKISYTNVENGCWAKWNIALANAGNYNVTVNICGQYGHNYSVEFLKEGETTPIVVTKNVINYTNNVTLYANELGNVELEAGNYEVKVSNAVGDASLLSLKLTYKGGAIIDIPGSIALNEAILTSRAFIDGDGLHFADADNLGHISEEYAKWNIHVAADGMYKFTANCNTYGTSYSNLTIQVLEGGEEKYTYTPQYTYTGAKEIKSPEWFLEAGNYELKLSNPANHSNGYLVSLSAAAVEGILIVDEMATDMQNIIDLNSQSRKPLLKRSFKGGMYNTVLFPFNNVSEEELANIFGEGYELIELTSASLEGSVLNLNFSPVDLSQDTYGRPYLIKPTKDVTNPLFNSHTIYKSTSHLVKSCDAVDFVGSFIKSEVPAGENNLFLGQNNMLYFSQTATPIKGTRAYFRVNVPGGANMVKAARIVTSQNATTDINLVEQGVQTQKIMENGQLFIIKNGVKYNAMGQMVK